MILPLEKRIHIFLRQFIEISDQMEPNGEVSNVEKKLYNMLLYNLFLVQCFRLRHLAPNHERPSKFSVYTP